MPAPAVRPMMPQAQSPAEVVRPLIWFRELNRMELPLISATEITAAAEITGIFAPVTAKST